MFDRIRLKLERKASFRLSQPDVIVVTETAKTFPPNYRVQAIIREKYPTIVLLQTIGEGPTNRHRLVFSATKRYPRTLWVRRRLEIYEGWCFVDAFTVEEICNPLLARTFPNRVGLLQDAALCDTAMSGGRSLNVWAFPRRRKPCDTSMKN